MTRCPHGLGPPSACSQCLGVDVVRQGVDRPPMVISLVKDSKERRKMFQRGKMRVR